MIQENIPALTASPPTCLTPAPPHQRPVSPPGQVPPPGRVPRQASPTQVITAAGGVTTLSNYHKHQPQISSTFYSWSDHMYHCTIPSNTTTKPLHIWLYSQFISSSSRVCHISLCCVVWCSVVPGDVTVTLTGLTRNNINIKIYCQAAALSAWPSPCRWWTRSWPMGTLTGWTG